jgi:predicted nuclease of restriction endonuclease-like (RecB) superfamily
MVLLDKVPDPAVRDWYVAQDVQHGWSSAVLSHHITTGRHARAGVAPNNFPQVLPPDESDQTREILQDPYALEFLALEPRHSEQDLEDALVGRLTRFLSELGTGFAFVGRQYKITVGNRDCYLDCSDSRIIPSPSGRVTFGLGSYGIRLAVLRNNTII